MELAPLKFLTFEDIIRDGACATGVFQACNEAGIFAGEVIDLIPIFPDHENRIRSAANLDGDGSGDGYGDGDGSGDGYGYGYGYGDGYGYGSGYVDGDGDGSGYVDGYGDGDGDGDGG